MYLRSKYTTTNTASIKEFICISSSFSRVYIHFMDRLIQYTKYQKLYYFKIYNGWFDYFDIVFINTKDRKLNNFGSCDFLYKYHLHN